MRYFLIAVSFLSLAILCVTPVLYATGIGSADLSQHGMNVGTLGWFAATPFWMRSSRA